MKTLIRESRIKYGMTQQQLADAVHVFSAYNNFDRKWAVQTVPHAGLQNS